MDKIFDWIMAKIFNKYVYCVARKKLNLEKVNRLEQYIWNRYFAKDFKNFVDKNT